MLLNVFYQNVSSSFKFSGESLIGKLLGQNVWNEAKYKKLLSALKWIRSKYAVEILPREIFAGLVCIYIDIGIVKFMEICGEDNQLDVADEICYRCEVIENLLDEVVFGECAYEWETVIGEFKIICANTTFLPSYKDDSFVAGFLDYCEWDDQKYWLLEEELIRLLYKRELRRVEMIVIFSIVRRANLFPNIYECDIKNDTRQTDRHKWTIGSGNTNISDRFRRFKMLLKCVASGDERFFKMEFYYRPTLKTSSV